MEKLPDEIRVMVEKNIDGLLEDPEASEVTFTINLLALGIEGNLETVLSYIAGFLFGLAWSYYSEKYHRGVTQEEIMKLRELLKRRAFELRDAFISTRIEP